MSSTRTSHPSEATGGGDRAEATGKADLCNMPNQWTMEAGDMRAAGATL